MHVSYFENFTLLLLVSYRVYNIVYYLYVRALTLSIITIYIIANLYQSNIISVLGRNGFFLKFFE